MSFIKVEVVYALPDIQYIKNISLIKGSNVEEAIKASGFLELYKNIELNKNKVGIFSRPVSLGDILRDGDRIEIYRPLIMDLKELRRNRIERANKKNTN